MTMKRILLISLFLFAGHSQAAPVTIDFEEITLGSSNFTSQGFDFRAFNPDGGTAGVITDGSGNQSLQLSVSGLCSTYCSTASVIMTSLDGGAFSLLGADLSLVTCGIGMQCEIEVYGRMLDGSSATGAIGSSDWLNLTEVWFSTRGSDPSGTFQQAVLNVDNVVVQAVPIPAAVWLFATALSCLGFFRRINYGTKNRVS
jgi:hypothetical protein